MADHIYPLGMLALLGGSATAGDNTVWTGADTYQLLLLKSTAPAFNAANHYVSDLAPATNEVTGTGYARKSLSSKTATNNAGVIQLDAADPATYTAANFGSAAFAVVFKNTGSDATSELLTIHDCVVTANGGDITVQFSSSPSAVLTVTPS